jgi:hypothetical protein
MRESDVRTTVLDWLDSKYGTDPSTRIVNEMGIWSGSARIDVAVINGELAGYELKSARDTLERLEQQAGLYSLVFDRVTLITAERHLRRATAMVPRWWGIVIAKYEGESLVLVPRRKARPNRTIDPLQVARLLWRPEALRILEHRRLDKGIRSKPVETLFGRLADTIPLKELCEEVRNALRARNDWLGQPITHERDVSVHCESCPH